ncbi:hypothetical protein AAJ72_07660 [Citromicrobium sp. RCC1885]|nr:hypothetical protein AAJ72_07660 [Citromicrobium sp. RCC1885]KPM28748.1 hypothetical protein AAJ74_08400 [Citromicrobium sp. RCC1878]OAM09702.1 hypothetical protein A0U43_01010 [Citromicrobium sp. RCC1897]
MREIIITQRAMVETSNYNGLTSAILDHDMPALSGTVQLDHYTDRAGFRGIMQSGELHLSPLARRLDQGELDTFAWEHGLDGYVEKNGPVKPLLRQAAADLFYTSFTALPPNDDLWAGFGDQGNGYRLRFEVTPSGAGQLREIRYHGSTTLLRKVNDALVDAGLPRFILKGISRVGAFYLPATWRHESETRLLAKRFAGAGAPVLAGPCGEYWSVPIDQPNPTADLSLIEIGVRNLSPAMVRQQVANWCATVRVVTD